MADEQLGLVIRVTEDVSEAIASLQALQAAHKATFEVLPVDAEGAWLQVEVTTKAHLDAINGFIQEHNAVIVEGYASTAAKINEIQNLSYAQQYEKIAQLQAVQQTQLAATHDGFLAAEVAKLRAVQSMETGALQFTTAAAASRTAARDVETAVFNKGLLATGGVVQSLEQRLEKVGLVAAAASGLGSTEFVKFTGIARTLANSFDHGVASQLNFANALGRGATAMGLSGAAADKAVKSTAQYIEAEQALAALKTAARAGTLSAVEAEALYATALQKVVAAEKAATSSGGALAQVLGFAKNHWLAIAAAAAVAGGGLIYAGEKAAHFKVQMDDLHGATGITTDRLTALRIEAMKQGIPWENVSNSLIRMASRLGQATDTNDRFHKALRSLGITGQDINKVLDQTVTKLGHMEEGAKTVAYHTDIFSRVAGQTEVNTVKLFRAIELQEGGLKNLREEMVRQGLVAEEGAVRERALLMLQNQLSVSFQETVLTIGSKVVPALETLMAALANAGKWWQVLKDIMYATNPVLAATVDGFHLIVAAGHLVAGVAEFVWNAFKTHFPNVARLVGEVVTWIGEKISWVFGTIGKLIGTFGDWAKAHDAYFPKMLSAWANLGKDISAASHATSDTVNQFEKLAAAMGKGKDLAPDLEGRTKQTHTYNDALAQMLKRHQDIVQELQTGELPARQKISLAMDNGLREAIKEIESSRQLAAQHKISRDEMAKREQEFAQLRSVLFQQWQLQMNQEMTKEHDEAQKYIANLTSKTKADQDYMKELGESALTKIRARERAEEALIQRESQALLQKLQLGKADADYASIVEATQKRIQVAREKSDLEIKTQVGQYIQKLHDQANEDRAYATAYGRNKVQEVVANTAKEEARIRAQADEEKDALRMMGLYIQMAAVETAALDRIRAAWEKANKTIKTITVEQELKKQEQSWRHLEQVQGAAMRMMESNGQRSGRDLINVFRQLNEAIKNHAQMTKEDMAATVVATGAALVAFAGHQKAAAAIMVIWETAEGIRKLAEQRYEQAALHFLSAAEYGVIAGTKQSTTAGGAGGTGSAGTPPDVAQKSISDLSKSQQAVLAPGSLSSTRQQQPLTVLVMGESSAAQYLTKVINNGVEKQNMRLVASHTKRPAPANSR